jgi:lysozyme
MMDSYLPWHTNLDEVRQEALINFVFNVGIGTAQKFKNAMTSLEEGDYDAAAEHMLDSAWARQVGDRAIEITDMIKTGEYQ